MKHFLPLSVCGLLSALLQAQTTDPTPLNERVMVVYNMDSEASHSVAKYYMLKRNIPKGNSCRIETFDSGIWESERYEPDVKKPLRVCLQKLGKQKILYIVMAYGTPYVVEVGGHGVSVDQLIADIWDEYSGPRVLGRDVGDQPYFGAAQSQGNAYKPFAPFAKYRDQPGAKTIYSVWRLDAPTPELAKGLVDKALYAESNGLKGKAYFDMRRGIEGAEDNGYGAGEWDIYRASVFAKNAGFDTILDDKGTEFGTAPSLLRCENAALYAGWYTLQHYNDAFSWVPGAIGFHLDSASATNPRKTDNWSGGALLKGITVTSGSVSEPFLEGLVHPDQVFLYLFQGANVGDAVLRGTRWLKWMILNLGDPLYRPFPAGAGPYHSASYREDWLKIMPDTVIGGGTAVGILGLRAASDKAVPISLKSTNSELVTLPGSAAIAVAGTGARFSISTKSPPEPSSVTISATLADETLTNTLTLLPLLMDVTLSQPAIRTGATLSGAVTLYGPAPAEGLTVKLTSSHAGLNLPAELKFPAGAVKGTFLIKSEKGVNAEATATITAAVAGASREAQLKITP